MKKALTLTVVANMTSNYSEGLGNIASVQKVFRNRKVYTIRSRESLKNAIMVQSGLYNDLETEVNGATQKVANQELNAANCRALEGGYMSTKQSTYIRKSSFYITDAISCDNFINETRFHNNLYLAMNSAKIQGINLQEEAGKAGLMPYQYEYDKSLKVYSVTIDLEMVGKDDNFQMEASQEEKAVRVIAILDAIQNLSLTVKGNLDNAEPIFCIGGMSERKTHVFENVVKVNEDKLIISEDLVGKWNQGYEAGLLNGNNFLNEEEIICKLQPVNVSSFFLKLKEDVKKYYGVA